MPKLTKAKRNLLEKAVTKIEFEAEMSTERGATAIVNVRLPASQVWALAEYLDECLAEADGEETLAEALPDEKEE